MHARGQNPWIRELIVLHRHERVQVERHSGSFSLFSRQTSRKEKFLLVLRNQQQ